MRQVSQLLDTEHRAALDLLGRLEQALSGRARAAAGDPRLAELSAALVGLLEHDTGRHFAFEESELFTRLTQAGEGNIAELLTEEHEAIRAVASELLPLARAGAAGTLHGAAFESYRLGVLEIVERQVSHIQKETMALLPLLDDLLEEADDRELAFGYAAT